MMSEDRCALCRFPVRRRDRVRYLRWAFHRSCLSSRGLTAEEAADLCASGRSGRPHRG